MLTYALRSDLGATVELVKKTSKSANLVIVPALDPDNRLANDRLGRPFTPEMHAEGYFLEIKTGYITILAQTPHGLFNGLMTLCQIIRSAGHSELPGLLIADYPAMSWRAVSDDFSRGQVSTMDDFKKIIRFLAAYKFNVYMPYYEDLIRLEKYPQIGQGRRRPFQG
jgi:hypothetical protein